MERFTGEISRPGVKLGRRPGDNLTRDQILDAAEEEFALRGYAATSLREVTERAGVNQALVKYYFGSKEGLFRAIFLRRGEQLARERVELLDLLEQDPSDPPGLEAVVRAFLAPAFAIKRNGAGGLAFLRLQARLQNEPQEIAYKLRGYIYEASTQRYIAALHRAVPEVDPAAMYWRMVFVVGAYLYTISDVNRLESLSDGRLSTKDAAESERQLVSFLVGGLRAPLIDG